MIDRLFAGISRPGLLLLAGSGLALVAAPLVVDSYVLTILTWTLYYAFLGQSWNIMMGFAGQLSLGHALFVGLGAYLSGTLFFHFGVPPWLGALAAVAVCVAAGAVIGYLGFRFSVAGVYFALLTIAFAEFTRILFEHFEWVGATAGLFLPVENRSGWDLANLRGAPEMFYLVILALTVLALALSRIVLGSRLGYYWLAIREDPDAAQALGVNVFRYKMYAVMLSAGVAGIGGVWYVFFSNNLFPDQVFSIARSIELLLGPIIGGVGTLIGPILGTFILQPLGFVLNSLTEDWGINGIQQFFYGLCVVVIIVFMPKGVWPWLSHRLHLERRAD